ncbi:DUF2125 domain-containing protein [uncultured Paracoccus sp.]|uniref:DUF2125 domain-containing protein n=1 Tax=uncultured Paracoccus sp. TaxID=189685 RepID=UPI00259348FA|nr:DUF2125 domain-containing protein [uncultured Paracoccus sp.]
MNLRLTSSALALAAMTAPAFADVTPEQVWQSWVEYYQSVGYSVSEGKREAAGDTLTVSEITVKGGTPEGRVDLIIPQIVLSDIGDGKVRTVYADQMTGQVHGVNPEGTEYALPFTIDLPGNTAVTSGAIEDMTHELNYPTIDITLSSITTEDKETKLPVKIGLADSVGTMHFVAGTPAKYDYDVKTGKVTFTGDITSEDDVNVKFDGSIEGVATSGDMVVPADGIADISKDMNAALKAGLAMNGLAKAGALAVSFEFSGTDEYDQPTSGSGKYDGKGLDFSFSLSSEGVSYQAGTDANTFELASSNLPFPINYAIESSSFDVQLPAMKSDEAQPFKFTYSLTGLTLGDAIWNLFDAQGQLPRDPATLDIDVTGTMKVIKDLFDPATMADADTSSDEGAGDMASDEPPFEPIDLTINQVALNALGAKIHAEGALKAPESGDMTTPVGELNASYEGVNGLIDKLSTIGLIPEDQAMSVRMMMAMFAKPVGDDKLETKLEFKEDGSIFANGQQIK